MVVNWIIDELLSEHSAEGTGFPSLAVAAREAGHNVLTTKYVPFSNGETFGSHYDYKLNGKKVNSSILYDKDFDRAPTIVHGTIEFCKLFEKHVGRNYTPGLYFNENVKRWSKFAHHIEQRDLLNNDYYILPYGEFERRQFLCAGFTSFIKPEVGMKEFTGQVIWAHDFQEGLKKLQPYHRIDPDTLCVVAEPKDIKAEFRYVIANRKVITGSEYRWDNKLDVRLDTHPVCDELAGKIARAEWQADTVYICDIALRPDDTAKVVELNAFSSSGLYACDTRMVVEAVSHAATKEWQGELEDQ